MRGVVAAGHPLTAQAGADTLRAGGNAVDAALAAMFTSFVAEPLLTGFGAGGYMLVAAPGQDDVLLDFFVAAPSGGDRAPLVPVDVSFGDATQVFNIGAASCGVYGVPAGVHAACERFGTMPLAELCAPAAALARAGVEVNAQQAYLFEILAPITELTEQSRALFMPEGRPHLLGEVHRDPALAEALERFGAEGPAPFYSGEVAATVVEWVQEHGGTLSRADLAAYEAIPREPVRVAYRGREVLTNPPPSAGGTLLAYALALLERGGHTPDAVELARAMEAAQSERTPSFLDGLAEPGFLDSFMASRLGSTTHISVMDEAGWACAVTCTNGEGSGLVVPGTGVHVNNMMGEQDLSPHGLLHPRAGPAAAVDDGPDGGARRRAAGARARVRGLQPDPLGAAAGDRQRDRPRDGRAGGGRRPAHALGGRQRLQRAGHRRGGAGGGGLRRSRASASATSSSAAARRSSATRRARCRAAATRAAAAPWWSHIRNR